MKNLCNITNKFLILKQNSSMNNTIIFFISLILILMSIMLIIRVKINFDLYGNYIDIEIFLYGIKLINIYISIIGLYIQINNKKKLKTIDFVFDEKKEYLFLQMKKNILDKLYIDNINLETLIGVKNSSFTAILITILNQICFNIKKNLENKNRDIKINYQNTSDFVYQRVKLNADVKVYFTIFDMVFAIILSFYERGKYVKEREKSK